MIDIHDGGSVRNLERIQEDGPQRREGRGATFALIVGSGALVLFASAAFGARKTTTAPGSRPDPLAELAVKATTAPTILPGEVTFPGILSDRTNPATALAAAHVGGTTEPVPPPPTDRLAVVPLPARHALGSTTAAPAASAKPWRDRLSVLADGAADATATGAPLANAGAEGGWQLQVSSFRTPTEANAFATQLRARGHRAHVQRAEIPDRGTWYRVKVGPFGTQGEANRYRSTFEAKEKMPGFVVRSDLAR
jgi:cell division septation protein DedD